MFDSSRSHDVNNGVAFKDGVGIFSGPDLSPVGTDQGNAPLFSLYMGPDGSRWTKIGPNPNDWIRSDAFEWNPQAIWRRECPFITTNISGEINFLEFGTGSISKLAESDITNSVIGSERITVNSQGKYHGLQQAINEINLGQPLKIIQYWKFAVETLFSLTQQHITQFGFMDQITNSTIIRDGAWFEYNGLISPNWILKCASNLITTSVITNLPVDTNYHWFTIQKPKDASTVNFFIDDVLKGSISTNIPKTTGRNTGIACRIQKTLGNTTASVKIDHYADEFDGR